MKKVFHIKIIISFFLLFFISVWPLHSYAETVNGCHCFKNRSYDPVQKFASDDYILATSFNSLTSKFFSISKKDIVMIKMKGGTQSHDLLIGLKVNKITGIGLSHILSQRKNKISWQKIISSTELPKEMAQNAFLMGLQGGQTSEKANQLVADEMLTKFYGVKNSTINQYRQANLNEKEIALLLILAKAKKADPNNLIAQYKNEGKSWSEIAFNLGVEPAEAGKMIINSTVR